MKNDFDAWFWKGDEMRLFRAGEEIPNDWYDAPNKFNGADPVAFDHDGDGRAGGSFSIEGHWPAALPGESVAVTQPKKRGRPPKVKPDVV